MNEENQPEKIILPEQNQTNPLPSPAAQEADPSVEVQFLRPQSVREADQENTPQNNIPVVPKSILRSLRVFLKDNPDVLHKFLFKKISDALKKNQYEAKLFYLGNRKTLASLRFEDFGSVLEESMKHFIHLEDYEMAAKCKEVLTGYYIEKVIHSTNSIKE
jgi:AAA+ ATPase superfamily predicted ATPase